MSGLIFRKATKLDKEPVRLLYHQAVETGKANGSSDWNDEYPSEEILEDDLISERLFVLIDVQTMVGAVSLMETDDLDQEPLGWAAVRSCVPVRLCVSAARQRQGLGERLMNSLAKYARDEGYESFRLLASHNNPAANRLYQKMGYSNLCRVHLYKKEFIAYELLLRNLRTRDIL